MPQSLEKQLAEAREEKGDLEKTYRYAVHEIKKLQEKLANHHIENEDGQRRIHSGESGIICDSFKSGQNIKFKNELMIMKKENLALFMFNNWSQHKSGAFLFVSPCLPQLFWKAVKLTRFRPSYIEENKFDKNLYMPK